MCGVLVYVSITKCWCSVCKNNICATVKFQFFSQQIMPSGLPWVVKPYEGNDNLSNSFLTSHYNQCKLGTGNEDYDKPNGTVRFVKRFHNYIYTSCILQSLVLF